MQPTISRSAAAAAAGILICAMAPLAHAESPGDVSAGGSVQQATDYGTITSALYGIGTVKRDGGSVTVAGQPGGAVAVSTPASDSVTAYGVLTYYAEIVGPSGVDPIPLRLYFDLSVSSDVRAFANTSATAEVVFANTFIDLTSRNGGNNATYSGPDSYLTRSETTNSPFKISLDAQSFNGGYAYADPMLELDPVWAAANPELASEVSLSFSPGVDNALGDLGGPGGVPEPSDWSLMILGAAMLGGALRGVRGRATALGLA